MNFYDLLKNRAEKFEEKIFLQIDEKIFSYAEFFKAVDTCEISGEGREFFISGGDFCSRLKKFFAAQKSGKIPVLLHDEMKIPDVRKNFPGANDVIGVFTGGTTGTPKILYRTYESWANFFPTQNEIFKVGECDKIFLQGNLSFTGNLNSLLAALYAGATVITCEKFLPGICEKLIERATVIYLVPAKLRLLTGGKPVENISSIFSGSQILTANQSAALQKKFPNAEIFLYYGASEVGYVSYKKISPANIDDVKNMGKIFPGVNVEISGGKIYVDCDFCISGIETPYTVGDFGHFNSSGDLIFEGRGTNFINRGGVKIFAGDIETKLMTIPGVEEVAVEKFSDEGRGEDFKIYVVGKPELKKIIRRSLKNSEMPREIIFVKKIPDKLLPDKLK